MCHDFSDRREGRTDFFDVNPHFSWTRSCSDQLWCWACVASNWKKTCIDPKTTTFFKPGYDTLITHLPVYFFHPNTMRFIIVCCFGIQKPSTMHVDRGTFAKDLWLVASGFLPGQLQRRQLLLGSADGCDML